MKEWTFWLSWHLCSLFCLGIFSLTLFQIYFVHLFRLGKPVKLGEEEGQEMSEVVATGLVKHPLALPWSANGHGLLNMIYEQPAYVEIKI